MQYLNIFKDKKSVFLSCKKIDSLIRNNAKDADKQTLAYGIILAINYPLYYLIWLYASVQTYENILLRLSASFFCVLLIIKNYWPKRLKVIFPYYWYFTVWYGLPFFFTFMTLKNQASTLWLMNCVSVLFFMLLLFDVLSVALLLSSGILCGWIFYKLSSVSQFVYIAGPVDLTGIFATFIAAFFIGGVFSHNKHLIEQQKVKMMEMLGASIAHEIRTPLGSIANGITGVKKYFPLFLDTYQIAKNNNLDIPYIRPDHFEKFLTILEDVESETTYANTIINMLLVKVRQIENKSVALEKCSIADCIKEAIHRYPFGSDKQSQLIHWEGVDDFVFMGSKTLMVHVLFNLMKNALYYIEVAGKGEIYISLELSQVDEQYNKLYFKDTGQGMPSHVLSKLFTRFFTTSSKGTGLGLSFCKTVMNSFGGDIICKSLEGEYAEFILSFPEIRSRSRE